MIFDLFPPTKPGVVYKRDALARRERLAKTGHVELDGAIYAELGDVAA